MRLKLYFNLENSILPIQYRKSLLSFIKLSLSQYNEEEYKKLYNEKDNIIKPYTFSVFLNGAEFKGEEVLLSKPQFELKFSTSDYNVFIVLYNAFNRQKYKPFSINNNSFTLQNIELIQEKEILSEKIAIKFVSPLIVRDRNRETRKDYYYSFGHENFKETLKINIKEQLKITDLPQDVIDSFNIEPIKPDVTIVKFYEKQIECSLGSYILRGDIRLLKFLYQAGMGSKRSSCFGMFDIV